MKAWWRIAVLVLPVGCNQGIPPPIRVTMVGVDGAAWRVIDPLLTDGQLPNLARLIGRGTRAPLRSRSPLVSPPVWTTIATGRLRADHGIKEFNNGPRLVSSRDRRVPALWNVASRAGRSVAVIGWWATYPAEHVNGVVVSERALKTRDEDIKGMFLGNLPPSHAADLTYPPEILVMLARYLSETPAGDDTDEERRTLNAMRIEDAAVVRSLLALRARPEPFDLEMVLLRGVDPVSHFFWKYYEPDARAYGGAERPRPEEIARLGDTVPNHYRYVDGLLGELVANDPSRVFVVISDHGFEAGRQPFHSGTILSGTHKSPAAQDGILVLAGGPIRPDVVLEQSAIEDVAPTVLRLLGLEIAHDLVGQVLEDAIDPAWLASNPATWIESYVGPAADLPATSKLHDSTMNKRLREELRSLGYIE